ncbi:hypothetical protein Tco_0657876 [Tanacetum coccineum]
MSGAPRLALLFKVAMLDSVHNLLVLEERLEFQDYLSVEDFLSMILEVHYVVELNFSCDLSRGFDIKVCMLKALPEASSQFVTEQVARIFHTYGPLRNSVKATIRYSTCPLVYGDTRGGETD